MKTAEIAPAGSCIAGNCSRRMRTRTLCFTHYNRLKRRGDIHWKPKGPLWRAAWKLWKAAKYRARKLHLEFSITVDFVFERIKTGKCEVTGADLKLIGGQRSPWSASLDRKNPSIGYTPENSQLVCWIYNAAKGDHSHADVLKLASLICEQTQNG